MRDSRLQVEPDVEFGSFAAFFGPADSAKWRDSALLQLDFRE